MRIWLVRHVHKGKKAGDLGGQMRKDEYATYATDATANGVYLQTVCIRSHLCRSKSVEKDAFSEVGIRPCHGLSLPTSQVREFMVRVWARWRRETAPRRSLV